MPVRAGEGGRLFGAVTVADIAGAVAEAAGEQVDKRTIVVGNPIKSLGAHQVTVKVHDEVDRHGQPQRRPRLSRARAGPDTTVPW